MEHLESRIAALELAARRWRRAAVAGLLAAVMVATVAAAPHVQEEVRARNFILVDEAGIPVGAFQAVSGNAYLTMKKRESSPSIELAASDTRVAIVLRSTVGTATSMATPKVVGFGAGTDPSNNKALLMYSPLTGGQIDTTD